MGNNSASPATAPPECACPACWPVPVLECVHHAGLCSRHQRHSHIF